MVSKISTLYLRLVFILLLVVFSFHFYKSPSSKTNQAGEINKYCLTNQFKFGNKETCYSKQFEELATSVGPEGSFKVLDDLQKIDEDAVGCHLIAHGIGHGSFERNQSNWQALIQNMSPTCNYGAIHGVLEAYVDSLPNKKLSKDIIPKICGEKPRADCNHIVGHLILVFTEGHVPRALDLCDIFTDSVQLNHCYTGVFMEEETALNLVSHGYADKEWLNWPARLPELDKMCRTFGGEKLKACWTELVHVIAVKYHNNAKEVFDYCAQAPDVEVGKSCKHHGIGIMAAGTNFDLPRIKFWCDLPQENDPNWKSDCYTQLAASTISTIPKEQNKIKDFCQSLESAFQSACFNQIKSYNDYTKNTFSND